MNNDLIIENLLAQGENERLEFKTQANADAIAKTVVAFLNSKGGDLVIGIADDKQIVGVPDADSTAESIHQKIISHILPTAPISLQVVSYQGKSLLLISAWEGAMKPYHYKDIIYSRTGQQTKRLAVTQLPSIIRDRKLADFSWERNPVLNAELEDLDLSEINRLISAYTQYRRLPEEIGAEEFLLSKGFIQNGNLTNACVVLFARKPVRFLPQIRVRLTVYPSAEVGNVLLDDRFFEGGLLSTVRAVFTYFETVYSSLAAVGPVERTVTQRYPLRAIREGLMNALVHRDYQSASSFLTISLFSDRLEINNYGSLPEGITVRDLKIEHSSILRNPDIAYACFMAGYVELLGSGTLRMIQDCRANGFKAPVWSVRGNSTHLSFPGLRHYRRNEGASEGASEGVNVQIEGVSEEINAELSRTLAYLRHHPTGKAADVARYLGKGVSTAERYLKVLRDNNIIKFIGANKTGSYLLLETPVTEPPID